MSAWFPAAPGRTPALNSAANSCRLGRTRAGWRRLPLAGVRALLDRVNAEDKVCTERVYRGLCAGMSEPGPLSHLERPNFEFAQWIARRVA